MNERPELQHDKVAELKNKWFEQTEVTLAALQAVNRRNISNPRSSKLTSQNVDSQFKRPIGPPTSISSAPLSDHLSHDFLPISPIVRSRDSRPHSAVCGTTYQEKIIAKRRPESAKCPFDRFKVVGVGFVDHSNERTKAYEEDEPSTPEKVFDEIFYVPPSSPKSDRGDGEVFESKTDDFTRLEAFESTQAVPRPQFHLQLPVVSDIEESDENETERPSNLLNLGSKTLHKKPDFEKHKLQIDLQSIANVADANEQDFSACALSSLSDAQHSDEIDNDVFNEKRQEISDFMGDNNITVNNQFDSISGGVKNLNFYDLVKDRLSEFNRNICNDTAAIPVKTMTLCDSCLESNKSSGFLQRKTADADYCNGFQYAQYYPDELYNSRRSLNNDDSSTHHAKGPISHGHLNLKRNGVHFKEERNKIFNITPRNRGRKIRSAPQRRRTCPILDRRLISNADYDLAMDICRMPMTQNEENGDQANNKSKHVIDKTRDKLENLISIIKRGTTDNIGELVSRCQPMTGYFASRSRSWHNDGSDHDYSQADNTTPNYYLHKQNNASSCKKGGDMNSPASNVVESKEMTGNRKEEDKHQNKASEKESNGVVMSNDGKPMIPMKISGNTIYDPKPITQQNTKMSSTTEKNYYDIIFQSVPKSQKLRSDVSQKSKKDYDVQPNAQLKESGILDCLQTQQLLKNTLRKISANRSKPSRPIIAWTRRRDSAITTPEKPHTVRKISKSAPLKQQRTPAGTVDSKPPVCSKPLRAMESKSLDDVRMKTYIEQLKNGKPLVVKKPTRTSKSTANKTQKTAPANSPPSKNQDHDAATMITTSVKEIPRSVSTSIIEMAKIYAPNNKTPPKRRPNSAHVLPVRLSRSDESQHLTTKQPSLEKEDNPEGMQECVTIHNHLGRNGIDLDLQTLKRALLPPDGSMSYFKLGNQLPKDSNSGLLSNPKTWLPEEHRRLKRYNDLLKKSEEQIRPRRAAKRQQGNETQKSGRKRPASASV